MTVTDAKSAIADGMADGDEVYVAGFGHLRPHALVHEVIRQDFSDLGVTRPNLIAIFDQMIGAGCVGTARFSWTNGSCFERASFEGIPRPIEFTEYSHYGTIGRIHAGARDLPFLPVRSFAGSDLVAVNDEIRFVESPYDGEEIPALPPLYPDVTLLHAHRADPAGNVQIVGLPTDIRDAAYAAETVIASVEEVVGRERIQRDANNTVVPESEVDYVVEEPFGAHPAYVHGEYVMDRGATGWAEAADTQEDVEAWLEEWIYGVADRREYLEKIGVDRLVDLRQTARALERGEPA